MRRNFSNKIQDVLAFLLLLCFIPATLLVASYFVVTEKSFKAYSLIYGGYRSLFIDLFI